ncbi:molybdenum cofactor biosynthesis protein B [Chamaesiphon sp.]|uniref:MogA/MoaB family molybdenum cofactor biosynthesis protein n=1 Tax=Chamaesiphon sp. TaxID=2814140 RepID=UPI003594129C
MLESARNVSTGVSLQPHPDLLQMAIDCAVITVSDTRTPSSDRSGELIQQLLLAAGHTIGRYQIIPDEPTQIWAELDTTLAIQPPISAIVFNGGTGISPRDRTYDALSSVLTKTLPGFGELFRWLSYQEIGSRAISSRALAGTYHHLLVFSLPGSRGAVQLGMEKLILPELIHLTTQAR